MKDPTFIRVMQLSVYDLYEDNLKVVSGTIQELVAYTGMTKQQLYSRRRSNSKPRLEDTGRKVKREVIQVNGMKKKSMQENNVDELEFNKADPRKVKVFISNAEVFERELMRMHRDYFKYLVDTKTYDDGKAEMLHLMDEIDKVMNKWAYASEVKEWQMVEQSLLNEIIEEGGQR